ncbi:hypothetical protein GF325_13415 [Candidatus Bathyarchaeota archaeon]|nr:hypothetical protein [Candidatus Bathyarchaeota archaeon]
MQAWRYTRFRDIFNNFFEQVKSRGILPLSTSINDFLRLSTGMNKVILKTASMHDGTVYLSVMELVRAGFIDPLPPLPT